MGYFRCQTPNQWSDRLVGKKTFAADTQMEHLFSRMEPKHGDTDVSENSHFPGGANLLAKLIFLGFQFV